MSQCLFENYLTNVLGNIYGFLAYWLVDFSLQMLKKS